MKTIVRAVFTSILFLLVYSEVNSQNFSWQHYQSYSDVNCILDAGDSIWIGTTGGVAIFRKLDSLITYLNNSNSGLKDNSVTALERDIYGNIWVGTMRGNLVRYDGLNWSIFNSTNSILPGIKVESIHADSLGSLWVASGYLFKFDGINWQVFYSTNTGESLFGISCITNDWNNHLWVGTFGSHKILEYDGVHWFRWDTTVVPYATLSYPVTGILCDKNGSIWFSSFELYKKCSNHFYIAANPSPSLYQYQYVIAEKFAIDSLNNFWIPWNHGFFKYVHDSLNSNVTLSWFNKYYSSYLGHAFRCTSVDKENNKWFGGYSNGLVSLKDSVVKAYDLDPSLPGNWVRDVGFEHGGNIIWIATKDGLAKFQNNNWVNYHLDSLPVNNTETIQALSIQSSGFLWVLSPWFKMYYFNLNDPPIIPIAPPGATLSTMYTDSLGVKWIGSNDGTIHKFSADTLSYYFDTYTFFKISGFTNFDTTNRNNDIESLIGTSGIELATELQGLGQFDGTTFSVYDTSNSFLPTNRINAITHDQFGNRWLGTDKGIVMFNPPSVTVWDSTNTPIPENFITALKFDYHGRLWAGTKDNGLLMYNDTTWYNYTMANSVLPGDWVLCIKEDPHHRIWVGTDNGLAMIEDSLITSNLPINAVQSLSLGQNYPNPANSYTQFSIINL
jgi:ligand-binding sensor domain-containing protein